MSHSDDNSFLQKIGSYTLLVLILGLAGGLVYQTFQMKLLKENLSKNREMIKAELHSFRGDLGRSQTNIVRTEKELRKLISTIPQDIKKDINKWGAEIVSAAKFNLISRTSNKGKVKRVKPKKIKNSPTVKPSKGASSKSCNWEFSDWRLSGKFKGTCGSGDFSYSLRQSFEGVLIEGSSNSASPSYLRVWELGADGKRLPTPMTLSDFTVTKRKPGMKKMHWLALHLDIGISLQISQMGSTRLIPDIGVSFSGYGRTKNDLDWRFFKGSIGPHEEGMSLNLCPASYNVGQKLPLFSNLWVAPCYGFDKGHSFILQLTGVL